MMENTNFGGRKRYQIHSWELRWWQYEAGGEPLKGLLAKPKI